MYIILKIHVSHLLFDIKFFLDLLTHYFGYSITYLKNIYIYIYIHRLTE